MILFEISLLIPFWLKSGHSAVVPGPKSVSLYHGFTVIKLSLFSKKGCLKNSFQLDEMNFKQYTKSSKWSKHRESNYFEMTLHRLDLATVIILMVMWHSKSNAIARR